MAVGTGGFSWAPKCSVQMDGELSESRQTQRHPFYYFLRTIRLIGTFYMDDGCITGGGLYETKSPFT